MPLLRELAVTALLLLSQGAEAGFYPKKSNVLQLDNKNFKKEILDSNNAAVVEFYAPWCGHCQNLKPTYEKLATSMKGIAKVAAVDCDEDANKSLCSNYGVNSFPTLKIFYPSKTKGQPAVEDYRSGRTAKMIAESLVERIPDHVANLRGTNFDQFLTVKNDTAKAILFTKKEQTSPLWRSLAIDFLGAITFAQVRDREKEAVEAFGIKEFPTVIVLPGGSEEGKVFEGKMEKQALWEFFAKVKKPLSPEEQVKAETATKETKKAEPKVTEKPKQAAEVLGALEEFQEKCLTKKAKTCILAVTENQEQIDTLAELNGKLLSRPPPHTFQVFRVDGGGLLSLIMLARLDLKPTLPQYLAVHHRGWYRLFSGNPKSEAELLAWLDAVKMGEGEKKKIPDAMIVQQEEPKMQEKMEEVAREELNDDGTPKGKPEAEVKDEL